MSTVLSALAISHAIVIKFFFWSFEYFSLINLIYFLKQFVSLWRFKALSTNQSDFSLERSKFFSSKFFIDSIFTPIKNVKFGVENFRVEQKTDYEKLVFEIITDGSIHPKDALTEAAKILIQHFMLFADENVSFEQTEADSSHEFDEDTLHMRQLLKTKLIDLELSVRALNCLKTAEVETLGELVSFNKSDLLKFRNFGKKSLTELEEMVLVKGLNFGMDIAKFNLDKE